VLTQISKELDEASAKLLEQGPREYLGASVIGKPCLRQVWYIYRWVKTVKHGGRVLRLLERGNLEEQRLARWLRAAGYEVREYAGRLVRNTDTGDYAVCWWDDGIPGAGYEDVSGCPHHAVLAMRQGVRLPQWGFIALDGNYRGHADGLVRGGQLKGWGLLEFKTHNEKSFENLKKRGVLSSKPEHYTQAQVYMFELQKPWCLYVAVCKNTDEIHTEIIPRRLEIGQRYREIAQQLIEANEAPPRISSDPSWWECKFCDFRAICHKGESPQKNCRSCAFSRSRPRGVWYCEQHKGDIPQDFVTVGCQQWEAVK
jgi:hypothetical protein